MSSKSLKLLFDALISGTIAVILLVALEFVLRTVYPEKVPAYQFDSELLVDLKPNVTKLFQRSDIDGGDVIDWKTNADAFRGPELEDDPELRVIVYGDSNIQARFSHLSRTFPFRLEKHLESLSGRDIEVVNSGVIGAGPDQSLIRFSGDVEAFQPDIVVFHVFADNDLGDLVRNRIFQLDESDQIVRTEFETTVDVVLRDPRNLMVVKAAQRILSALYESEQEIDRGAVPTVEEVIAEALVLEDSEYAVYKANQPRLYSHFADHYDFDSALRPAGESAQSKKHLLAAILDRAKSLADAHGIELVVLIQPSSRDLSQNLSPNYTHLQQFPNYRKDRLTSIVEDICARKEIRYVNLYPVFSAGDPASLYFGEGNDHWNDAGQELAASRTAEYMVQNMLRTTAGID